MTEQNGCFIKELRPLLKMAIMFSGECLWSSITKSLNTSFSKLRDHVYFHATKIGITLIQSMHNSHFILV